MFDRFRAVLAQLPDRERQRLQRVADLAETAWRRLALLAEPLLARVTSDDDERAAIDRELARHEPAIGKRLVDELRWARS